ncbi:MAG: hypothetical protein JWO77_1911 [Ilumatobacteraceae bacterium]|nr:hypothetical protein [Ilumatobacteraceae bacterium]
MRLPDRIWVPGLVGLVLALVFVGALLVRADGDPSILVHAGAPCTTVGPAPSRASCDAAIGTRLRPAQPGSGARGSLTVQPADQAFDGQFFYRIGVSPWSAHDRVGGVQNDLPALRNARWGYGALAWAVSAGDPDLVPWALIAINVAAAFSVGAIGGGLARSARRHPGWGALFVLWPGFAYSLSLDTSELMASALLLGGLLALRHQRWAVTALLLTAAVITRDTTTVVPFAVAVSGLWAAERGDRAKQVAAGAVPLAAFAGWQLLQRSRFGSLPLTSSGDNNLSAPLSGLVDQLTKIVPPGGGDEAFRLLSASGLIILLAAGGWALVRQRPRPLPAPGGTGADAITVRRWPDAEQLAWLGALGVILLLNAYLWSGATAFMRASTEAGLLSILLLVRSAPSRLLLLAGTGLGGLWLLTAIAQLTKVA